MAANVVKTTNSTLFMIIWSGFGILVPLVAIVGFLAGMFISSSLGMLAFGPGIGCVVAALGNWGLWKLIYPKEPKVLIDPATRQQVVVQPNHSLFFIPARVWTWIFVALTVPALLLGILGKSSLDKEAATPGFKEFEAADKLIGSKSKGEIHGNSDEAKAAADKFSDGMKTMISAAFSGGSKKNLMTGGSFLTYCREDADAIVFLCHVPSLRSYKSEEAKAGLNKIAWTIARSASSKLDPKHTKTLIVGLRGVTSYGSVQQGNTGDEAPSGPASSDKADLYPFFAAKAAPATN